MWVGGVATNGIKFLPSLVKNDQLVEALKLWKQTNRHTKTDTARKGSRLNIHIKG